MTGFHLVTDLDGTWLPDSGQLPHLRRLESSLLARTDVVLTFATGRTFTSVLEAIGRWALRLPHHLITDVGTAIFHRGPDGGWMEDQAWSARVAGGWDASAADRLMAEGLPPSIRPQPGVAPIRRLALQLAQGRGLAAAGEDLALACRAKALAADILPSHGLYLDVLPPGVDKGAALTFLQADRSLPRPIVACGDSANDLGLLAAADHPILMRGGLEDHEAPAALVRRAYRTKVPGPEGIHQALTALGLLEEDGHAH